jgi:hypothetical protein
VRVAFCRSLASVVAVVNTIGLAELVDVDPWRLHSEIFSINVKPPWRMRSSARHVPRVAFLARLARTILPLLASVADDAPRRRPFAYV